MVELTALNLVIVLGIVAFYIVTVWAIVVTVRDPTTFPWMTALWIAALILFPGIGLLAWLIWRIMRKKTGLPGFTRESHRKH